MSKSKARGTCACGCDRSPARWNAEYVRGHRPLEPLSERLWRRVVRQPSGCWEWQGYRHSSRGYGQIGRGGRDAGLVETHRAAWEVTHGPIPAGLFICHRCDNPPCVNPGHLFLGTRTDNVRDMWEKGRGNRNRGMTNGNTRLTSEQVAQIRERFVQRYRVQRGGTRSNAKELAAEYGISVQYVGQLARGLWRVHG